MDNYHRQLDLRSRALHELIAHKIRLHPEFFDVAKQNVERWATMGKIEPYYLKEWRSILAQGMDTALRFAIEDSAHATQLRQSSPFTGVLTEQERSEFLKRWKENNSSSNSGCVDRR
jgi:hypothetical protein